MSGYRRPIIDAASLTVIWLAGRRGGIEQLLGLNEGSLVLAALRQVPFSNLDGSDGVDLYLDQERSATFAGDVNPETARVMAATQRPWSAAALSAPSGPAGVEVDPLLVPAPQRGQGDPSGDGFMAERATSTIEEVPASNASMVSQPDAATNLIVTAVNAKAEPEGPPA
jgi:hypothetical protein